jgi:hypothetical protein
MTATKNNVPPSSTLVMTVLVLRTSPSRKFCMLCALLPFTSGAQSVHATTCYFLDLRKAEVQLRRITLPHTPVNKGCLLDRWGAFSMVQG